MRSILGRAVLVTAILLAAGAAQAGQPLKVFVLAGQSNMQGQAADTTLAGMAGFVWFQGWNDMVDGHTYPGKGKPDQYTLYSELLGHFIRDVRKDLKAPNMPFVIGVMGTGGNPDKPNAFREAMAAPAAWPEFKRQRRCRRDRQIL